MGESGNDPDRRKEALEEGLEKAKEGAEKAKQGAKKLAGWLGKKLGAAADQLKETEPVREKLEQYEKYQEERAHDKLTGALAEVYDTWILKLRETMAGLDEEVAGLGKSVDSINYNINELRLRNTSEQDDEMREYHRQVAELREEQHELEASREPFQDEIDRMLRQRRAALARLEADAGQLESLKAEGTRQVTESHERLQSLPDQIAEQRSQGDVDPAG